MKIDFNKDRPDKPDLIQRYDQGSYIQIPDFLSAQSAEFIYKLLASQVEWNLSWNDKGKHVDLSYMGVMNNWSNNQHETLKYKIYEQAQTEFQYNYLSIPIFDIYHKKLMPNHFFKNIYEFLNSQKFITFIREITNEKNIKFTDMQATKFLGGHFLTEHDDDVKGKNRLAAYVLNLTPEWKDDWGGALVFPDENKMLFPRFNVLNIFPVPQRHFVSFVTPFAGEPRYSITGWFRY